MHRAFMFLPTIGSNIVNNIPIMFVNRVLSMVFFCGLIMLELFMILKLIQIAGLESKTVNTFGILLNLTKELSTSMVNILSSSINNIDAVFKPYKEEFSKVFPIEEVREYTMRFLSSCLSGEIREEKFYFWTGSGGNGKSKLIELFEYCFGDY